MKKIIYSKLVLFIGAMFIISCLNLDEELRNVPTKPIESTNAQTIPVIGADANVGSDAITTASYARLREGTANHGNYFSVMFVSSDEGAIPQKGGDWFDGGIWLDMHKHTYKATNGPLKETWDAQYASIAEVNKAIDGATAGAIAELKVLRAFFHWRLLDAFGRIRYIDSSGSNNNPQLTRAAGFDKVRDDLLSALGITVADLSDLSNATFSTDLEITKVNPYRVNRYVALSLLARLYLNAEVYTGTTQWQTAHDLAKYVIDNGGYMLHNDYAALFAPDNGSNGSSQEIIWSIPYDETTNTGMNFATKSALEWLCCFRRVL